HAALKIASMTAGSAHFRPLAEVVTEKSLFNSIIALLASGGSTNHTIHMIAVARAAGILLTWQDISDLSDVVPLLARVYPNGPADMNAFQDAGGV
ncbi:dihydroxy-acid dehydratase, partial [Escherichia coli]|nr:dihydroxy-acid dehydratase [Escherichia coli]